MDVRAAFNVTESGDPDGPPMLFAHGFGCDQQMWRQVAPHFEDRFRVIRFDWVGAGGAQAPYDAERYASLDGYAEDLVAIIEALALDDVVLVAHSVAAMIGVLAEQRLPGRIASLVMVGPSPRYIDDEDYVGGFQPADIEGLLQALESNYLGWSAAMAPVIMDNPDRPELGAELERSFCRLDPEVAERWARATFLSDNRQDLPGVRARTLVVQSQVDAIAPPEVGRYVAEHVPDAEIVVLDTVGHCPHLSAPREVCAAMDEFLAVPGLVAS